MGKKNLFSTIIEVSLAAAFLLASCNASATPVATDAPAVSPTPVASTATFTPLPSLTDIATLVPSETPTLTATQPPTPTDQITPQVNPGMNAYCRKGPGTYYYAITFLQAGTNYTLLGQNGLNTWWKVQVARDVTCWIGDPTSVMVGPVWDVPILPIPPLPGRPASFTGTITCHSVQNILNVSLTWKPQNDAAGFHLYRNGVLLGNLDPTASSYQDNSPPFSSSLDYELEAYNENGVSYPASVSFPLCG